MPLIMLMLSLGLPMWFLVVQVKAAAAPRKSVYPASTLAVSTHVAIATATRQFSTPTLEPTFTPTLEPTFTPTLEPTFTPTLEPTATIFSTKEGVYDIEGYKPGDYPIRYSRYYPNLLGVNCHTDNVLANQTCADTTSSGLPWSSWLFGNTADPAYRGGVAVPLDWSLGVDIVVISPAEIAGRYLAVDYCPACANWRLSDGVDFIDFLDENQTLDYWTELEIRIEP